MNTRMCEVGGGAPAGASTSECGDSSIGLSYMRTATSGPEATSPLGANSLLATLEDLRDARINYKAAKERYGEEVERLARFRRAVERAQHAFNAVLAVHTGDTQ